MMINYLIDTDWIINYLFGQEKTFEKVEELKQHGIALSVISLAELYEGVYYSKNPEASQKGLEDFLEDISVLGIQDGICKIFGRERGRLRKQGNIIGDFDLLIAATCLHYNFNGVDLSPFVGPFTMTTF
jgi:tRNA(fMet)-specific endonuclease VapC